MKTIRIIIAFIQALLPFIGFGIISMVVYTDMKSPYNIFVAAVVIGVGFFASRSIFNMMRRRGVMATMSGNNSTYDLDSIEFTETDGVYKLTAQQVKDYFIDNKLAFKTGTVSIYGDWEGRRLDRKHHIKSIDFNEDKNVLTIIFADNCLLKIRKPRSIFVASTYLKIVKATEVLWQIPTIDNSYHQFSYLNTGKTINTKSNTDWKPHPYDIGIGMDAIYLQG